MKTPICDFVKKYIEAKPLRVHMPGHKGVSLLGMESLDITEFDGADNLYEADSIIAESEKNASLLFGCNTYYSTEGSSHCIRAMVYLVSLYAKKQSQKPLILVGRNAHKTFLSAVALLDCDVEWLYPNNAKSYLSCQIDADYLDNTLCKMPQKPTALYLTSPDYLGTISDIGSISRVCKKYNVLLLVDCAHGAYLKFLEKSLHPIDLGADMCCCSAHKTLPVLTGGAYLQLSFGLCDFLSDNAKSALALFGSTSPSYLILQSLDAVNKYLSQYKAVLNSYLLKVNTLKDKLISHGYTLFTNEPLKLTILSKPYGYTGTQLSRILLEKNIVCEFYDPDFVVMMLTPQIDETDLNKLADALISIPSKASLTQAPPEFCKAKKALSIREATMALSEKVEISDAKGRVLSSATVGCPPAVPILVSGEIIDDNAIKCFKYYGIKSCNVVSKN